MRRTIKSILLFTLFCFVFGTVVYSSTETVQKDLHYKNIKITLDEKEINPIGADGSYIEPFIIDGVTYLPVRGIANALGLGVDWDEINYTVKIMSDSKENRSPSFTVNKNKPYVITKTVHYNNIKIMLDGREIKPIGSDKSFVEPFIIEGVTYLPVRGIANALGLGVDWDDKKYTVKLLSKGKKMLADGEFNILLIGNSFSEDASGYGLGESESQFLSILQSMLGNDVQITIGVICSGGKGMNWFATKTEEISSNFTLRIINADSPKGKIIKKTTLSQALIWKKWDVITLQPYGVTPETGVEYNAFPDETNAKYAYVSDSAAYLLDYINDFTPLSDVYCYMHWTQTSSTVLNAGESQYNKMSDFYHSVSEFCGKKSYKYFTDVIPVGLSIQNARTTYLSLLKYNTNEKEVNFITDIQVGLQRDRSHLSYNIGRYIASLTFAEVIIPDYIRVSEYKIPDIKESDSVGILPKEYTDIAQKAVENAMKSRESGNFDIIPVDGYKTDPVIDLVNCLEPSLIINSDLDTKEQIIKHIYKKAKKDTVIEEIILPNAIVKDIPSVATLTVRFGYTSVTFDINLIVR